MSRRTPVRAIATALLLLASGVACAPADPSTLAPDPVRWNVLLIVAEDLGPRVGAYGDRVAHTPNIDRLAREGMRFTRAFTTSGVCAPSRAAILMGVHQNRFGAGHMRASRGAGDVEGYAAVPPPSWKAFPELLRRAGYHVSNGSKTDYQLEPGFASTIGGGPETIWDDSTHADWRARDDSQAFFTQANPQMTHESRVWPTWHFETLPAWLLAPLRIADHLAWPIETSPADVVLPPYYVDTPTARADIARHYNNIALLDERVGELLERLEADGLADRTVVIFTTDHGDGLPRAKRWLYDSGIRVPLIVRWPGVVEPGSVNDELVSLVDLAPTVLAIAGERVPSHFEGRVFVGPDREAEPAVIFAARDRMDENVDTVRAVRDRRFKYVRNLRPDLPAVRPSPFRDTMPMMQELHARHRAGTLEGPPAVWFAEPRPAEELYDLEADPHEIANLAQEPAHAETLARLRAELDRRLDAHEDLGLLDEAELRERFFPGGVRPKTSPPAISLVAGAGARHAVVTPTTEGASIRVRVDDEPWRLYGEPIALEPGSHIEARAVRYGWSESEPAGLRVE